MSSLSDIKTDYMSRLSILISLFLSVASLNLSYAQQGNKQNSSKIIYLAKVNSLDELFGKFKGQLIYTDFWASWCSSCLEEFKPQPELDSFLKFNNIVRLYIALERQENDSALQQKSMEKWKGLVEKHNLAGYHYYVQLKSDFFKGITEKIMKGKLSLPRFSIIDRNGIISDRDARYPSNVKGLIKQLSAYIE